jgi:hypothetical protein
MRGSSSSGCNCAKGTPIFSAETQKAETKGKRKSNKVEHQQVEG